MPRKFLMFKEQHFYLIYIQFLGFRYSGWQKQPNQRTIEGMLSKTLGFILPDRKTKILGAGRTDAKVSANEAAFELFLEGAALQNLDEFIALFNLNLPADIKILAVSEVDKDFNIIQHPKTKEYIYLFSFGEKNHPFCAPFMANIQEDLNIKIMIEAASMFQGTHNFRAFTARPRANSQFTRTIDSCILRKNDILKANFFPKHSYALHVKGAGFMRYQIRMIMGALIQLGKEELCMDDLIESFHTPANSKVSFVAPGSGLLLHKISFQ